MKYRENDCGCWIDGSYGIEHQCAKLASMLPSKHKDLIEHLIRCQADPSLLSDDMSEIEEVTEVLNSYCTPNVRFIWESGNLILIQDPEEE